MTIVFLLYLIMGSIAGILAGLFGIGGGVIVVPSLAQIFAYDGLPNSIVMHMAAGTSLASIIFTMAAAVFTHYKRKTIVWSTVWQLAPGIIIGTILGAYMASILSTYILKIIFALFVIITAIHLFFSSKQTGKTERALPSSYIQITAGLFIGLMAGLLGVGGGIVAVPILLRFGLPMHSAAATSAMCALVLSIVGTISFIVTGWHVIDLPLGSTGFVYWPAALAVAITAMIFAPLGAKLAQRLSGNVLKRCFAILLLIIGITMLIK